MKINKLTATSGALSGKSLSFHEGLNIAEVGENEGARWCELVSELLYGSGSDAVNTPASVSPTDAYMELTSEGCDITLSRSAFSADTPMHSFSAVYTGTERAVEGIDAGNAGEMLTGVTRQVFDRCAVVGKSAGEIPTAERIQSLSRYGEEAVSYDQADSLLRLWQRDRRCVRRGALPELESKIDRTKRELSDMEKIVREAEELEAGLEEKRRSCGELERAVNESRRNQRRAALDRLTAGRNTLRERGSAHDMASCALSEARDKLKKAPFGESSPEKLEQDVQADLAQLEQIKSNSLKKPSPLWGALCFLMAVIFAALYTSNHAVGYMIAAVVFCLGATWLIMRYAKLKNSVREAADKVKEILARYSAADEDDIRACLERHRSLWEQVKSAERAEISSREEYDAALKVQQELESSALGELNFTSHSSEAAQLSRQLAEARGECESISSRLSLLRGKIATAGDPLVLSSALSVMAREHELLSDEFDAIELAINTLRDADTVMQSEVSPELIDLAYRYMTVACDGMQGLITDGTQFFIGNDRNTEALAYLSIRLAICQAQMPAGESLPLLLCGVLSDMDASTASQGMELLREVAKKRQVILFN